MYELMLVSKLGAGDELLSLVEKNLKGASATDLTVDKLGKKPLAYSIKKQTEAEFIVLQFNVEGAAIPDLTDILRLEQENLLRYLLTVQKRKKAKQKKFAAKKEDVIVKEEKAKPKVTVVTTSVKKVAKVSQPKAGRPLDEKVSKGSSSFATSDAKALDVKKATKDKKVSKIKAKGKAKKK